MALNLALISFEFSKVAGLSYNPEQDFDFARMNRDPEPGEAIQSILEQAYQLIRDCLAQSISPMFSFGSTRFQNYTNYLHVATTVINLEQRLTDGTLTQTYTTLVAKFYRLQPSQSFKVTLDIEEMPSSGIAAHDSEAHQSRTLGNKGLEKLVQLLNDQFSLADQYEYMPLIKRGNLQLPRYLVSSDERVLEYDFDKLLYHKRSPFQDIKIVSSPSLGNTLLLDNLQNLAEVDLNYTHALMDFGKVNYADKEILILGGGDGALLWELLKENPKFVTMAEIDESVIDACRKFLRPCGELLAELEGPNYRIVLDDCKRLLHESIDQNKKYDVIFNDLTDIPVRPETLNAFEPSAVQRDNQWHFIESIFNLSLECLSANGLYINHATGKGNLRAIEAYEEFLNKSKVPVKFESRAAYVPSFMEIWTFYTVRKRKPVGPKR